MMAQLVLWSRSYRLSGTQVPRDRISLLTTLMTFTNWVSASAIVAGLCLAAPAHAQLRISESVIEMHASDSLRQVDFHNDGEQAVHVTLELQRVVSPATSNPFNEHTIPADADVLTITPSLLHIPAKQSVKALVRRAVTQLDTDEVYRLQVKPMRKPNASPIVLNYDMLLLVRPNKASPSVFLKRTPSGLSLVNVGNSNALMSSMQLCDQSIDACEALSAQRLYAKQRWSIPVPEHFNVDHLILHAEQVHQLNREVLEYRANQLNPL